MTAHTPTPWEVSNTNNIVARHQTPELVAKLSKTSNLERASLNRANAAHIVKCVNAHDALVAVAVLAAKLNVAGAENALKLAGVEVE